MFLGKGVGIEPTILCSRMSDRTWLAVSQPFGLATLYTRNIRSAIELPLTYNSFYYHIFSPFKIFFRRLTRKLEALIKALIICFSPSVILLDSCINKPDLDSASYLFFILYLYSFILQLSTSFLIVNTAKISWSFSKI